MTAEQYLVIAMFSAFMTLLMLGFPVAWALTGVGFLFAVVGFIIVENFLVDIWFTWGGTIGVLDRRIYGIVANELMVAVPLFIFMGLMLDRSGVAERLMNSLVRVFAGLRGGYAITVVLVGVLLAASTGIVGASVILLGMLSVGPMLAAKYNKGLTAGTASAVGTLGILIPPSIMLVLLADRLSTPEASVGRLFMAALIPGLLLGLMYIIYIIAAAYINRDFAPAPRDREPLDVRQALSVLWAVLPPLGLIVAVLGSIVAGIATTTEASAVGAFGAILLAALYGKLNVSVIADSVRRTSLTTAFIFGIFIGATIFASVLRGLGGDDVIRNAIVGLPFGEAGIVLAILALVFILGFFLDWIEITLIVLPLVAPVVFSLGVDPLWFSILFAICLQTSFLTPPVGPALFYIKGVCPPEISTRDIYLGVAPYVLIQLTGLFLVFWFSGLATWLPRLIYG